MTDKYIHSQPKQFIPYAVMYAQVRDSRAHAHTQGPPQWSMKGLCAVAHADYGSMRVYVFMLLNNMQL